MAKTYRKIHEWDLWLGHFPGDYTLKLEQQFLSALLAQHYGKHALLIGTPHQHKLLKATIIPHRVLLTPVLSHRHHHVISHQEISSIESELDELPLLSGSVDLVILPHVLEYVDNPPRLLSEACRIIKPNGHIVICGFNPYSLWGLKKLWMKDKHVPWIGNFIPPATIKKWLALADFELIKQVPMLFRPPVVHEKSFQKLQFLEWVGNKCHLAWGGIYMLLAQAKVIPLTPIRLRWQQKISSVSLPIIGIPRPTIRNRHE